MARRRALAPVALAAAAAAWWSWHPAGARAQPDAPPPRAVAVFPLELVDTSGEPPKPGHPARAAATAADLAGLLAGSGRYRPVDLAPIQDRLAAAGPLHRCGGCWLDLARDAGAEVAVVAVVHKVSTLVSSMHALMVDVPSRRPIREAAVSLRGDTDEAWLRAARYLARHSLLNDDAGRRPSLSSPFPGG